MALRGIDTVDLATGNYRLMPYAGLKGILALATVLAGAIERQELIVVVADYDCDGATACAIAVSGLTALGARIEFVVPNRFRHGYGLTPSVVEVVAQEHPEVRWITTVDNGIASVEGVAAANERGIGVLVTDHHLPGAVLPDATAIVNPNQPGCTFPSKHLAGCGVMYYVLAAVRDCLRAQKKLVEPGPDLAQWLDLVALGTVADVVRLDANNRWLVRQGLARIRAGQARPGIRALFEVAKRDPAQATTQDFGFALGPRINAAGRIDDMSIGIRCLLATDEATALVLAHELDELNQQRKQIEGGMRDAAWEDIDLTGQAGRFTRVVYDASFHEGVIGIVAGRIKEQDHAPTVVFADAQEGDLIKGSGRSIPGVHLRDALDLVHKRGGNLFHKFGGHAMAAGMTLPRDRLEDFKVLFEQAIDELLEHQLPTKQLEVDGDLPPYALADDRVVAGIMDQVWGQGFEEPTWEGEFELLEARLIGADANHLKMRVAKDGYSWWALQFFCDQVPEGAFVRLAYKVSLNEFRGERSVDLMVVDKDVRG